MSEFYIEEDDELEQASYVDEVIAFINERGGRTTKREIGRCVQRPRSLNGPPLAVILQQLGFEVSHDQVREGLASLQGCSSRDRRRVRRRGEDEIDELQDETDELQPVRKRRKRRHVTRSNGFQVSADVSRLAADTDAPFEYRDVAPVGEDQRALAEALRSETPVIFALGVAGTGKTWLAVQEALRRLQRSQVRRIVITRPAVEADDKMGALPGGLHDKMMPFLLPIIDAIDTQSSPGTARMLLAEDRIKIAALSHMRGTTLDDSFVIADEMQNATLEQLKMLMTRHGKGTKLIICGDTKQSDRFGMATDTPLNMLADEISSNGSSSFRIVRLDAVHRSAVAREAVALFDRVELKRRRVRSLDAAPMLPAEVLPMEIAAQAATSGLPNLDRVD